MDLTTLFFWLGAFLAFFFGLGVILARNPMHSAISLIATLVSLSGLYLLLHAEFLAWIIIIVYTGAVMVLIIFVISLLNLQRDDPIEWTGARRWSVGLFSAFVLVVSIYIYRDPVVGFEQPPKPNVLPEFGSAKAIAVDMFTRYLLPFELASILLTAAVIGAVVTARKTINEREPE